MEYDSRSDRASNEFLKLCFNNNKYLNSFTDSMCKTTVRKRTSECIQLKCEYRMCSISAIQYT